MNERRYVRLFLLVPALLIAYFTFQIFRPFILPVVLAAILVTLTYPIYDWLCARLGERRSLSALLTCLTVLLVIVLPVVTLLAMLAGQVTDVYLKFQRSLEAGEFEGLFQAAAPRYAGPFLDWLGQFVDLEQVNLMESLTNSLQALSVFFLRQGTAILSGVLQLITSFLIMLVTMFFLFRDGERLKREVQTWSPLSEQYEELLVVKFREVGRATILGSLVTALAQGLAGGVTFWILGLPNALFWGSLMAVFSLIPVVGTGVVWVPWVIYLLIVGSPVRALILTLLAVLFVGMIDNVVRPLFIEGRSGMHTLLVFFALMGGVAYFGIIGLILGPIIVALALTFVELCKMEFRAELAKPDS